MITINYDTKTNTIYINTKIKLDNGGEGSGNFGHKGRPGKVGGSAEGQGSESNKITKKDLKVLKIKEKSFRVQTPQKEKGYILPLEPRFQDEKGNIDLQKVADFFNTKKEKEEQKEKTNKEFLQKKEKEEQIEKEKLFDKIKTKINKNIANDIVNWTPKNEELRDKKYKEKLANQIEYIKNLKEKSVDNEIKNMLATAWDKSSEAKKIGNMGTYSDFIKSHMNESEEEEYYNLKSREEKDNFIVDLGSKKGLEKEWNQAHRQRNKLYQEKTENINKAIKKAEELKYNYGKKDGVLYFDLPDGRQISFHDFNNQYETDKEYKGEWCGFTTTKNPVLNNIEEYKKDIFNKFNVIDNLSTSWDKNIGISPADEYYEKFKSLIKK